MATPVLATRPDSMRGIMPERELVGWSLTMVGLCVFSATIVTTRLPLGVLGIGIAILGLAIERPSIEVPKAARFYILFLLWAFAGSFVALEPGVARAEIFERLKLAVIFVVAVNALRTRAQLRFYLLIILFCFLIYPVRGALHNYFVLHYTYFGRALWNGGYANPNDLGALCDLALGIAITFALGPAEKPALRMLARVSAGAILLVMLLTQSRGAFIGLVIGIGWGLTLLALRRGRNAFLAVLALLALAVVVPDKVWHRLGGIRELTSTATIAEADPEGSAEQRFQIQKTAWRIATDHVLFGVGLGNYGIANQIYAPGLGARDTHDTYLNLWAEAGLPGLLLWIAFVVTTLRRFQRRPRRPDAGAGAAALPLVWIQRAVIGVLVSGLFGTYANLTLLYLLLGVLASRGALHPGPEA